MNQKFADVDYVYESLIEQDFDRYGIESFEKALAEIQAAYRPFLESKEAEIRDYALTRFLETVYYQKKELLEIAKHQCLSLKETRSADRALLFECDKFLEGRLENDLEALLDLMEKTENEMLRLGLYVPRQASVTREMQQLEHIFSDQASVISLDSDYEANLQKLIDLFQPFADSNYPEVSERAGKLFLNRVYGKGGEWIRAGTDKDIYSFGKRVCIDLSRKIAQLEIDQKDFPAAAKRTLAQCELFLKGQPGAFDKSFFASVELLLAKIDSYTPDPLQPVHSPADLVKTTGNLPIGTVGANYYVTELAFMSYLLQTYPQLCYAGTLFIANELIFLTDQAEQRFAQCWQEGKEWIFLQVSQHIKGPHANMLVINFWTKEAELFEPHGSILDIDFEKFNKIQKLLYQLDPEIDLIRPAEFCPRFGPQAFDPATRFDNELDGYCVVWSFYWLEQRLIHGRVPRQQLYQALISENIVSPRTIQNYARWMILIKEIMLQTFLPQITSINCQKELNQLIQWREKLRDQPPISTQLNVRLGDYSSAETTATIDFSQMIDKVFQYYDMIQTNPVTAYRQLEELLSKVKLLRQRDQKLGKFNGRVWPDWAKQVSEVLEASLIGILYCYKEDLMKLLGLTLA